MSTTSGNRLPLIGSWLIFRYLFRQHLAVLLLVLSCLFLIVLLGQFADMAQYQADRTGWSTWTVLVLSIYRTPTLMQAILPHATLISAALMVSRTGRRMEAAIMMQNGLSPLSLLLPVGLAAGFLAAVFALCINPISTYSFNLSEEAIRSSGNVAADPDRRSPREITLTGETTKTYVLITHVADEIDRLVGVSIYKVDTGHLLIRAVEADGAVLTGTGWQLTGAREVFIAENANEPPLADLRLVFEAEALRERFDSQRSVSFYGLPDKIRLAKLIGAPDDKLRLEYYRLLALPFFLAAVAFLAGAIVLRPLNRGGWKYDAALILVAAFAVYTISTVLDAFGTKGLVDPLVAITTLPVLCGLAGAILVWLKRGGNRIFKKTPGGPQAGKGTVVG